VTTAVLKQVSGELTTGWAFDAASAFAGCRHVAAHSLGSNRPSPENCGKLRPLLRGNEKGVAFNRGW
jgi:hypothetical protein